MHMRVCGHVFWDSNLEPKARVKIMVGCKCTYQSRLKTDVTQIRTDTTHRLRDGEWSGDDYDLSSLTKRRR